MVAFNLSVPTFSIELLQEIIKCLLKSKIQ